MSRESVLLLGGTGFIGSVLVARLEREGMIARILGRHDAARLKNVLPQCGTVIHLASATTPGSSASHPELELDNLTLSLRLPELMQNQMETHLVFFSSGGPVYGKPERMPVAEDATIAPLSNQGAGKAAQEVFCQTFLAAGHVVIILRPSNAYGQGQDIRGSFGLIRTWLEHARAGARVEIWGDGENLRDFIYIGDVVDACMRFIALPQDSGTYNLGGGRGYSINQVRYIVEQTTGIELQVSHSPARGIDVRAVALDISRIEARLSWKLQTSLEDGVKHTWNWLRQA